MRLSRFFRLHDAHESTRLARLFVPLSKVVACAQDARHQPVSRCDSRSMTPTDVFGLLLEQMFLQRSRSAP